MIDQKDKDIAQWAMSFALKKGCNEARVSLVISINNSFEYRNIQLDTLQQSTENRLYIELFIEGRYGSFSTNKLDKEEVRLFIEESILSIKLLAPDIARRLPPKDRYFLDYSKANDDLRLCDSSFFDYSVEQKKKLARENAEEIYGTDDAIISITSSYNDGYSAEYMIASNGFEGLLIDTAYNLSAEVSLKVDGDNARPEGFYYSSTINWSDIQKKGIAFQALQKAKLKLGQRKIKSGKYPILLDNTVSYRLLSPLISAMYGLNLQQKNSFLINKLRTKIASSKLTLIDMPHLVGTFGARWYDGEGVATKKQILIENGILNTYFIDTYNATKLNMEPTISSPSILTLEKGNEQKNSLIKFIDKGFLVTGFNGGNVNDTTGDFSFGIEGFYIERGFIKHPINEMNITGNIIELWMNLVEVGNDPFSKISSRQIPSLLFEDISVSGL